MGVRQNRKKQTEDGCISWEKHQRRNRKEIAQKREREERTPGDQGHTDCRENKREIKKPVKAINKQTVGEMGEKEGGNGGLKKKRGEAVEKRDIHRKNYCSTRFNQTNKQGETRKKSSKKTRGKTRRLHEGLVKARGPYKGV